MKKRNRHGDPHAPADTRWGKKFLALFLSAAMCMTMLPSAAFAAEAQLEELLSQKQTQQDKSASEKENMPALLTGENDVSAQADTSKHTNHTDWGKPISTEKELKDLTGNGYLTNDIVIYGRWWEPKDGVVLCLNGHSLTKTTDEENTETDGSGTDSDTPAIVEDGPVIRVKDTFTLTDCTEDIKKHGKITHAENHSGLGVFVVSGTFNMTGGSICGNAGGVSVYSDCTFNMYGGSITGNSDSGVDVFSGTFNLYDGSIAGNTAKNGGGVNVGYKSIFNMYGGSITGNKGSSKGGGVYVYNGDSGTVTVYGGTISGNSATGGLGGGVYVLQGSMVTVSGDAKITGNVKDGTQDSTTGKYTGGSANNVYLQNGQSITIDEDGLKDGASIGVTTENEPASGAPIKIATGATGDGDYTAIFTQDVTDKGFAITRDESSNVYLSAHQHKWNYTTDSNGVTLLATCADGDTEDEENYFTLYPGSDTTYDGTSKSIGWTMSTSANNLNAFPDYEKSFRYEVKDGDNWSFITDAPTNVGTYRASIAWTGVNGNTATAVSKEYTIQPKRITPTIEAASGSVYNGEEQKPAVTVKDGTTEIPSDEYNVSYSNNIDAGEAMVTVTDKSGGNYTLADTSKMFTIDKANQTINVPTDKTIVRNGGGVDISNWASVAGVTGGSNPGTLSYELVNNSDTGITLENGKMLTAANSVAKDTIITIKVTAAATSNYNMMEQTFTVKTVDKDKLPIAVSIQGWTYGDTPNKPSFTRPADSVETITYYRKNAAGTYEALAGTPSNISPAGEYKVVVECETQQTVYTGEAIFTIEKKTIHEDDLKLATGDSITKVYDGTTAYTKAVYLTLKDNNYFQLAVEKENVVYNSANVAEAKTATLTLSIPAGMSYKLADDLKTMEVSATITPMPIQVSDVSVSDRKYEKGNRNFDATVTFVDTDHDYDNPNATVIPLVKGTDYTTTSILDGDESASEYQKKVQINIELKNSNYALQGEPTGMYGAYIWKADAPTVTAPQSIQRWDDTMEQTLTPKWAGIPNDANPISFNVLKTEYSPDTSISFSNSSVDTVTGALTYTLTGAKKEDVGKVITVKYNIVMQNYEDAEAEVKILITDRMTQDGFKFEFDTKSATYGDDDFTMQATGNVDGSNVTYSSNNEDVAAVDGNGTVTIKGVGTAIIFAAVSDTETYNAKTVSYTLTVEPMKIDVPLPADKTYIYNGAAQTYEISADTRYVVISGETTETNANETGYAVKVSLKDAANTVWSDGTTGDKGFTFIINKAVATIKVKDQSAYVGSTAPALGEDTYTVSGLFGEDKLTTVPVLKYVDADGNEIAPDMTKTGETAIRASGASAGNNYTISYTDGKLTVSTRPSSGGGSSSSKSTYAVTTPSKTDSGAVSVTPKNAGKGDKVTVTITPDEGYKLDKLTVTDAKGNTLTVTDKGNGKYAFTMPVGKVTVTPTFTKVAEEQPSDSKSFTDVSSSDWYTDAVEYVADKGLMSGTGNDRFSPNDSTTRGMLMTILARYAGENTIGGATWYEKGMNWAKANGVSDGTNPNANITREQLVTMLYRYAKASGKDVSVGEDTNILSYADAATVSEYAISAMQWACGAGIVNGSNGKLLPKNNATRAEVAAILMRFCENVK